MAGLKRKPELIYIYPRYEPGSFNRVAREHIAHMSDRVRFHEVDLEALPNLRWARPRPTLVQPLFYPVIGDRRELPPDHSKRLESIDANMRPLCGIDTADSDRISGRAVEVADLADIIVLPSEWAKRAYERSGVRAPIEVVPHAVPDAFISELPPCPPLSPIRVLYFLPHSGYRKGADVVASAVRRLQAERGDVQLVVVRMKGVDPYLDALRQLRMEEVAGVFDDATLRAVYDSCHICLVPSRGGGFEMCALEAAARGIPTIVPRAGPFLELERFYLTVRVSGRPQPLPGNPIHVGRGWEVSPEDLLRATREVIKHIYHYRLEFKRRAPELWELYNWDRVAAALYDALDEYGFLEWEVVPYRGRAKVNWSAR